MPDIKKAEAHDPMEDYVEIKLFHDGDKYKDDVFVSVNGENCLIRRGVPVKVKRKFAQVLDSSDKQDQDTKNLIGGLEAEFRTAARSL